MPLITFRSYSLGVEGPKRRLLPQWSLVVGWAVVALLGVIGAVRAHDVSAQERTYGRLHPRVALTPLLVDLGDAGTMLGTAVAVGGALAGLSELNRDR